MKKKWIVVTVVSFSVMIFSVLFALLFVLPKINRERFLSSVSEGDAARADRAAERLSSGEKADMYEDIRDIVVYSHNQYADGKMSYEELLGVYRVVEKFPEYRGITAESLAEVQFPKLTECIERGALAYGQAGFFQEQDAFDDLMKVRGAGGQESVSEKWEENTRVVYETKIKRALDAYLMGKYAQYKAGTMGYEEVKSCLDTASSYCETEYTEQLEDELYFDGVFLKALDRIDQCEQEENYLGALDRIAEARNYYEDLEQYASWKDKFDSWQEKLTEKAKDYYTKKAIDCIANEDLMEAEEIVREMKRRFGDGFDTTPIDEVRPPAWVEPYLKFMGGGWEKTIRDYFIREGMDYYPPVQVLLWDLNGNGTPELLLDDGDHHTSIFTLHENNVTPVDYLTDYQYVGKNGEFIYTGTTREDGAEVTERRVLCFTENQMLLDVGVLHIMKDGEHRYLLRNYDREDEELGEAEYMQLKNEIDERRAGESLTGGAPVEEYEEYIRNWREQK